MEFNIIPRIRLLTIVGVMLTGLASCVKIDESLGSNFIPTDQIWDVFACKAEPLGDAITMERSDSLSGYSTSRFTFGSVKSDGFSCNKGTSFTLVPLSDSLDFGTDIENIRFRFTAAKDTISTPYESQKRIFQNVRVSALKAPLDSAVLYSGSFLSQENIEKFLDLENRITVGVPVYDGGDSLTFDFTEEYAKKVIAGIQAFQQLDSKSRDSLSHYIEKVPGIYIETDPQTEEGGRINMFSLPLKAESGYILGNYAELSFRARYDYSEEKVDTSFIFYFGPSRFLKDEDTSYPAQFAFNASANKADDPDFLENWKAGIKDKLYVEGGSGLKPVVKAWELKQIIESIITDKGKDPRSAIINKATIVLPYDVNGAYDKLDYYPVILSPTVKLRSDDNKYVTYAGLTDSSIESENQGNIDRSRFIYCPDISHHVQEILKLQQGKGENVNGDETEAEFRERVRKYDIWFLIMHEETVESSSGNNYNEDYYNSLLYNSYYNNMMYDPYGYGYGYGYGGYGGYGYNNYYNYYMMAAYANAASSGTTTSSSIELDQERFYNAILNGPGYGSEEDTDKKPRLKITFSAPKNVE